jgi:arylsulfatase A-like enzyme
MDWPLNSEDLEDVDFSKPIANGPVGVGFDYFFGISASLDMAPYVYIENDRPTAVPDHETEDTGEKTFWRKGPTAPDFVHEEVLPKCCAKAEAFIDGHANGGPFFLYFPLPAPHTPILPTAEFRGKSGTNEYGDFVLQVDHVVGRIMEALDRNGVSENTILIFTSDNGCSPRAGLDELETVGHKPSYIFRGHKADIYDGGHRIPLVMRWPARTRKGAVCDDIVCLSDLLATCADIIGAELPDEAGEDSVSNLPIWLGEEYAGAIREATVHHSIDGSFSIRQGRWKLEMCPGSGGWSYPRPGEEPADSPPIQLYDMEADVSERSNVQADHPDVVRDLTKLLTKYVKEGRSTPGGPQPNTGAKYWPQLNWLSESDL